MPVSTHAPLAGRDPLDLGGVIKRFRFQPTRPLRGATVRQRPHPQARNDVSTHAPLAGRDGGDHPSDSPGRVSTHAPLAGRDPIAPAEVEKLVVSTHAPLAGRDLFILW